MNCHKLLRFIAAKGYNFEEKMPLKPHMLRIRLLEIELLKFRIRSKLSFKRLIK